MTGGGFLACTGNPALPIRLLAAHRPVAGSRSVLIDLYDPPNVGGATLPTTRELRKFPQHEGIADSFIPRPIPAVGGFRQGWLAGKPQNRQTCPSCWNRLPKPPLANHSGRREAD